MASPEGSTTELSRVRQRLNDLNDELAFHVKEDHRGWPPSTCHRCLNFKQRRLTILEVISQLERGVSENTP